MFRFPCRSLLSKSCFSVALDVYILKACSVLHLFSEEFARGQSSSVSPRGGYGSSASTPHSSNGGGSYNSGNTNGGGGATPGGTITGGSYNSSSAANANSNLGSPTGSLLFNSSPSKFVERTQCDTHLFSLSLAHQ